jgi:hypothetical protein
MKFPNEVWDRKNGCVWVFLELQYEGLGCIGVLVELCFMGMDTIAANFLGQ